MLFRIIPFVVLLMLTACGASEFPESSEKVLEPVEVTHIETSITEPKNVIVNDQRAWVELWADHVHYLTPAPELPVVDFSKNMVVGIFLGATPNGCYSMSILSIVETSTQLVIKYKVNSPAKDAICTQVIVYQSKLLLLPKTSTTITFINETK